MSRKNYIKNTNISTYHVGFDRGPKLARNNVLGLFYYNFNADSRAVTVFAWNLQEICKI